MRFDHEGLEVYRLAVEMARWFSSVQFPPHVADLRDHSVRAANSIILNIAEGRARGGKPGANHFNIAAGSAAEICAVLDLADFDGREQRQATLRRMNRMLDGLQTSTRLKRPRGE
jgi:four helix bundle protein